MEITDATLPTLPLDEVIGKTMDSKEIPVILSLATPGVRMRSILKVGEMVLGREDSCDIPLLDSGASRRHAKFDCTLENVEGRQVPRVTLTDLKSTNGTFVNGVRVTSTELRNGDKILVGKSILGYFVWDEVTIRSEDALLKNASTDSLTGLHNRGFFDQCLPREFTRARRYKRLLSLVLLDIDNFKRFNDLHGHQAGDHVLQEVARTVLDSSRAIDFACRYGGEEIALVLPETGMDGAFSHAGRICTALRQNSMKIAGQILSVTASLGVAELDRSMSSGEDLVKAADQALYRAKREGRDRVASFARYSEDNAKTVALEGSL